MWPFRFVAVPVCGRFGLWPFRSVAVSVCGRSGLWPFRLWPFRFVAVMTCYLWMQVLYSFTWWNLTICFTNITLVILSYDLTPCLDFIEIRLTYERWQLLPFNIHKRTHCVRDTILQTTFWNVFSWENSCLWSLMFAHYGQIHNKSTLMQLITRFLIGNNLSVTICN